MFAPVEVANKPKVKQFEEINGLTFIENYLSSEQEKKLIKEIDSQPWLSDLRRRVQHYGFKYDYRSRRIDVTMRIGKLPNWATKIAVKLHDEGYFREVPDQLIVNEYQVGQGITPHIDCQPCFEDTIVSISLNSTAVMNFSRPTTKEKIPVFLPRRSAVILKGESRYEWKHSIPARKTDKYQNKIYQRERRVSLTFRKVII